MTSRYSIWMLLAGVAVGLVVGYLAGRGMFGGTPPRAHTCSQGRSPFAE